MWVQSALLALGTIFVCCIKVWPLWLKIVVWWVSLILLVRAPVRPALCCGALCRAVLRCAVS
jgi:hypothetical protein